MCRACHVFWVPLAISTLVVGAKAAEEFVAPPATERTAVATLIKREARVGIDSEYRVISVSTGNNWTNEDLKLLTGLERLNGLLLASPRVTDEGIVHLKGLTSLKSLTIMSSGLTGEGIKSLETALPGCSIRAPGPRSTSGVQAPRSPAGSRDGGSAGPRGPTPGGRGAGGRPSTASDLIRIAAVQDDLKMTPEQRQQIAEASDPVAWEKAVNEKILATLTAEQRARLKQVELQQRGSTALLREDIAKEMMLSADQRAAIREVNAEANSALSKRFAELQAQRGRGNAADASSRLREELTKISELNKQRDDKMLNVLTEEQRQAWKEMLGPPAPRVGFQRPAR